MFCQSFLCFFEWLSSRCLVALSGCLVVFIVAFSEFDVFITVIYLRICLSIGFEVC